VVPRGRETAKEKEPALKRIGVLEGGHPVPDEGSAAAASAVLKIAQDSREGDLVVVLVSGGGSALLAMPADGITLEEKREVTDLLLRSGCDIEEFNSVRKHVSGIKGGQLAGACRPAHILTLVISDVVGDPPGAIASGPTQPDPTTFRDAERVLDKYCLWERVPNSVAGRIREGMAGKIEETPSSGEAFSRARTILIGNNLTALTAMEKAAGEKGYNALLLTGQLEGESKEVGRVLAGIAGEVLRSNYPIASPAVIILGGETTVTVRGDGVGGRNQELVLGAALSLQGKAAVVASLGTDGIDGATDAAGAIADGFTLERCGEKGPDAVECLMRNDSNTFFNALHDLLITGPTNTNVGDVMVIVVPMEGA